MDRQRILTIVVTYNSSKWLKKCIASVKGSSYPTDLLVIDNNSTDNTLEIINGFDNLRLISNTINIGFGRANNLGLKIAIDEGYDFTFLMNSDTYLDKLCLEVLIKLYKSNKGADLLAPVQLSGTGDKFDFRFKTYLSNNKNILEDLYFKRARKLYPIGFVNAAAWLLPVNTVKKIGFFDPLFFMYGEDANYLMRMKYHSLKIFVCIEAVVRHDREERLGKLNFSNLQQQIKSQLLELLLSIGTKNIKKIRPFVFLFLHYLKNRKGMTFILVLVKIMITYPTILKHKKLYEDGIFKV